MRQQRGTRLVDGPTAAYDQVMGVLRAGGVVSRVGVPQYAEADIGVGMIGRNVTLTGGAAPVRAYIEELLPDVFDGTIQPGRCSTAPTTWKPRPTRIGRWTSAETLKPSCGGEDCPNPAATTHREGRKRAIP